ncbi:MAG TPA: SpoIIE family protein phosphatase, partial [Bacteroidota bacterium]
LSFWRSRMGEEAPAKSLVETLQQENNRLKRAVEELSVLNDLARAIGVSFNSQEIMQTIIRRSLKAIGAEQGVITLVDREEDQPMVTLVRTMVSSTDRQQFHFHQSLLGWMQLNKKPLLINDPSTDERFRGVRLDENVHSLLCVPMIVKSALTGVLTVYNKREGKKFTDDDQRLLAIIAAQSAQIVDNARLHEEQQAYIKMQEEVALAAKIQSELLPREFPTVAGYEIVARNIPAQVVGGDYFDFVPMENGQWSICLGDVSGKGLPASLLMANTQATLRSQSLLNSPPKLSIERANTLLFRSTSPEKFVTLFYAILDPNNHTLSYCNAGHDNPFLVRADGSVQRLNTGGLVLSIMEGMGYEEETVPLTPGDLFVLYSDGITESMNQSQEQFGEDRLLTVLRDHRTGSGREILDEIIKAAKGHAGKEPQADDMTVVVVKRIA